MFKHQKILLILGIILTLLISFGGYPGGTSRVAAEGAISITVELDPDITDATVLAQRQAPVDGSGLEYDDIKLARSGSEYRADGVTMPSSGDCGSNSPGWFDFVVTDNKGIKVGSVGDISGCESSIDITIDVESDSDTITGIYGNLRGRIKEGGKEKTYSCLNTTLEQGTGSSDIRLVGPTSKGITVGGGNGHFDEVGLDFGGYTLEGTCRLKTPTDSIDIDFSYPFTLGQDQYKNLKVILVDKYSSQTADTAAEKVQCQGGVLGWAFCAIIEAVQGIVNFAKDFVVGYLKTTPLTNTGDQSNKDLFNGWKNMRNLANVFLIPVFFLIIFAQALSLNIDAYTVKKMLPRLVAAAIFIQFSYFIVAILVDVTNVLGNGIGSLLTSTFTRGQESLVIDPGGVGNFLGIFGLLASFSALANIGAAIGLLAALSIPLLISVVGVLLTLVFRQLLIVLLAIAAPLAFASWVLPNTERMFKLWWSTLLKTLMMYPLITMLFAAGTITAGLLTSGVAGSEAKLGGAIKDIMALIAIIIPLAAVPFSFKFAGGAIAMVAQQAGKFGKMITHDSQGKPRGWYGRRVADEREKYAGRRRVGGGILNPTRRAAEIMNNTDNPNWLRRIPGTKGLRNSPGLGIVKFNEQVAAEEDTIAKAQYKPETLRDGAILLGDGSPEGLRKLDERIVELFATGDHDDATVARQLGTLRSRAGEQSFAIAMAKQAMAAGQKPEDAAAVIEAAHNLTKGNRALGSDVVTRLAYLGKAYNPEQFFTRQDKDGKLQWATDAEIVKTMDIFGLTSDSVKSIRDTKRVFGALGKSLAVENPDLYKPEDVHPEDVLDPGEREHLEKRKEALQARKDQAIKNKPIVNQKVGSLRRILADPQVSPGIHAAIEKTLIDLGMPTTVPGPLDTDFTKESAPMHVTIDERSEGGESST